VTLDALVVPSPSVTIDAPAKGVVHIRGRRRFGAVLRPGGAPVFFLGSRPVRPPVSLTFVNWRVPNGSYVPAGLPIAVGRYIGFAIEASTPPDLAYRIFSHQVSARGEIRGGPAAFPCTVLNPATLPALPDPTANQGNAGSAGAGLSVICAIPLGIHAVSGLRAFLAIRSALARNVVTVPAGAVAGTTESGAVWLMDAHGQAHLHRVRLGINNGAEVEVISGLNVGDTVSAIAPDASSYH
jgi:hypothetical protein